MIDGLSKASPDALTDEFEFVDGGRTFTCSVEAPGGSRPDGWWWFRVSPDTGGQRYAPFRVATGDTRADVQARVVAYYDDLLARRAQPATSNHWGRRGGSAKATPDAAPATPGAAGPSVLPTTGTPTE